MYVNEYICPLICAFIDFTLFLQIVTLQKILDAIHGLETRMLSIETSLENRMLSIETQVGSLENRMLSVETRVGLLEFAAVAANVNP